MEKSPYVIAADPLTQKLLKQFVTTACFRVTVHTPSCFLRLLEGKLRIRGPRVPWRGRREWTVTLRPSHLVPPSDQDKADRSLVTNPDRLRVPYTEQHEPLDLLHIFWFNSYAVMAQSDLRTHLVEQPRFGRALARSGGERRRCVCRINGGVHGQWIIEDQQDAPIASEYTPSADWKYTWRGACRWRDIHRNRCSLDVRQLN